MELKDQSTTKSGYSVVLLSGPPIQSGHARILIVILVDLISIVNVG